MLRSAKSRGGVPGRLALISTFLALRYFPIFEFLEEKYSQRWVGDVGRTTCGVVERRRQIGKSRAPTVNCVE